MAGNREGHYAIGESKLMEPLSDEHFMGEALKEAQYAFEDGEVPVGAIVVAKNKIIARAHNQTELLNDTTAHAEMLVITAATNFLGAKYLSECTLYVTLEPCVMCAGAMNWAQVSRVVYGASDDLRGFSLIEKPLLHPKAEIKKGVMAAESKALLNQFFEKIRE